MCPSMFFYGYLWILSFLFKNHSNNKHKIRQTNPQRNQKLRTRDIIVINVHIQVQSLCTSKYMWSTNTREWCTTATSVLSVQVAQIYFYLVYYASY